MDNSIVIEAAKKRTWDVVIIGSGIGGGTAAYGLARLGKSVLIIERGRSYAENVKAVHGFRGIPRDQLSGARVDFLKNAGLFWEVIDDVTGKRPLPFQPHIGNGVGGSSSIYGMAMERFRPEDFSPGQFFANAPGANVPETWPITYSELTPYYEEAERLYRVRGTPDPLGPKDASYHYLSPPPLNPSNLELVHVLTKNGLHPYYQPTACEYVDGCGECPISICPRACRNDSYTRCIGPAMRDHGVQLIEECEVTYLEADKRKITALHCMHLGVPMIIRARTVVLSAGALQTPVLLLKSKNARWSNGLANGHDYVGRYLMRHLVDLYFVKSARTLRPGEPIKQVSFNDFYVNSGTKLGTVQSLGPSPPLSSTIKLLETALQHTLPSLSRAMPLARPILGLIVRHTINRTLVYASILEDLPYADNRVTYDDRRSRICISYQIHSEAQQRLRKLRELCRIAFRPLPLNLLKLAHNSQMLAHQVGTCRFGTTPENSVLDRYCRVHELSNLFVIDGSFMPTSGGINPSLTIAANALRITAEAGR
jgi:choline dehydrogenase-like flavoprotein